MSAGTGPGTALHTAEVAATGGRDGHARSTSGSLDLDLARPATRGTGKGTDPEELFAAGYAACFLSSLHGAARTARVAVGDPTVTAAVSLHAGDDGRYSISAALTVDAPDCPQATLDELVERAHQVCPYSNALRSGAPVTLDARGRP